VATSTLSDLLRTAAGASPHAEAFRYRAERQTHADWDLEKLLALGRFRSVGSQRPTGTPNDGAYASLQRTLPRRSQGARLGCGSRTGC